MAKRWTIEAGLTAFAHSKPDISATNELSHNR